MKERDTYSYMLLTSYFALLLRHSSSIEKYMNFETLIIMYEPSIYTKLTITVSDSLFLEKRHVFENMQLSLLKHFHVVRTYKLLKTIIPHS